MRATHFPGDDGLLTMGLATRGPGFCQDQVVPAEWALARELGIPITVHVGMGRMAGRFGMVEQLDRLGLLGPDTTYVHCCYFSDDEWQLVADTGGTISIAPQVETQMGHGWPPVNKARKFGMRPSLSIDVVTTVPGDMFTQIRAAFGAERARVNAVCWDLDIPIPEDMLTATEMLKMATLDGAHVAGVEDRTGSLTPGKQADVVVIDATAINVAPIHDPAAAVTLCADVSNVEHVLVAGSFVKRDGKLAGDVARAMSLVAGLAATTSSQRPPRPPPRSRSWHPRDRPPRRVGQPTFAWSAAGRPARRLDRAGAVVGRRREHAGRCTPASAWAGCAPEGACRAHVHSYEESVYVSPGTWSCRRRARRRGSGPGDYGLIPVGVPHSLRNDGDEETRFVRVSAPVPRPDARLRHPARAGRRRRPRPVDGRRTGSADPAVRPHHRGAHGSRRCRPRSCSRLGEHAHRPARLQRDHA